jgi:DNA mismatch endonuclease (patch repair protein)
MPELPVSVKNFLWSLPVSIEGDAASAGGRTVNLGRGLRVPYPDPSSEAATKVGKGNVRKDTKAEVLLRSELHRRGLRFRKDLYVRTADVRVHIDVAFTKARLAVFVDGCFWHGCPEHQHVPKTNLEYWIPKLQANVDRDRRVDAGLSAAGWEVVRVWEHVLASVAADLVSDVLVRRRSAGSR